jgi:cholesterol transport system auxiliary component
MINMRRWNLDQRPVAGKITDTVKPPAPASRRANYRHALGALFLAGLSASLLSGCGAARPVKYYELTVPTEMPQTAQSGQGVSLAVGPIVASHLYREDHLVYSTGSEQLGTYEYQRWSEPPTEMIQEILLRELQATGRYRDISTMRSNSHTDFVLRGELYDFKEVSGGSLVARVTAEWQLRDTKTGSTVWTHYYTHDEPVASKDVPAMVAALDRNVQRGVGELKAGLEQYFASTPTK